MAPRLVASLCSDVTKKLLSPFEFRNISSLLSHRLIGRSVSPDSRAEFCSADFCFSPLKLTLIFAGAAGVGVGLCDEAFRKCTISNGLPIVYGLFFSDW